VSLCSVVYAGDDIAGMMIKILKIFNNKIWRQKKKSAFTFPEAIS